MIGVIFFPCVLPLTLIYRQNKKAKCQQCCLVCITANDYIQDMDTKKVEVFDELIAFRAFTEDKADLCEVAQQWQLDESEIARRALRAGLEVLRKFKLPGVREE